MKSMSVYKYVENLLFVPHGFLEKGPQILIEPITKLDVNSPKEELGKALLFSLDCSKMIISKEEETPTYKQGIPVFKRFLKMSKANSNKNLVQNGQLISVKLNDDIIKLERLEANVKFKGFGTSKTPRKIEMGLTGLSDMEIGKALQLLFNISAE